MCLLVSVKYKGLNTQSPFCGSYPPEQTYVCDSNWVLWSAHYLYMPKTWSGINFLRNFRIQFLGYIEFLPVGKHISTILEISQQVLYLF